MRKKKNSNTSTTETKPAKKAAKKKEETTEETTEKTTAEEKAEEITEETTIEEKVEETPEETTDITEGEPEDCAHIDFEDIEDRPCPFDDEEDYLYEDPEEEYVQMNIRRRIGLWLEKVSFKTFRDIICDEVKGQEGVEDILFCVYNYLQCLAKRRRHNNHVMVAAPSGCGKSATYQALRRYFAVEIPELTVSRCDLSNITETGYKGMDPSFMLSDLFIKVPLQDGEGIVFLDEFDKKMIPSYGSSGSDNNLAVQHQILTIIEGSKVPSNDKSNPKFVNTENTLFIAMGSFDIIRKERKEKSVEEGKTIGFHTTETEGYNHFKEITRDDILKLGSTNELMGRFPVLVNFHPLEKKVVDEIINVQIKRVGENFGTTLEIDKSLREELRRDANGPFGCREFYNKIFTVAMAGQKKMLLDGMDCTDGSYRIVLSSGKKFKLVKNTPKVEKGAQTKSSPAKEAEKTGENKDSKKEFEKVS